MRSTPSSLHAPRAARAAALPLLLLVALASAACAGAATSTAPAAPAAVAETLNEVRARTIADSLRRFVLSRATFAEIGDSCDTGVLRTFTGDTVPGERARTEAALAELERAVITQGIDAPDGTRDQVTLLETVAAWEGGAMRPLWDVASGPATKRAFAPGLVGRYTEGGTGQCKPYVAEDTVTIVIPVVGAAFRAPKPKGVRVEVLQGDSALQRARDAYFARTGGRDDAIFTFTKVRVAITWRDYAVAAVNRPAQSNGGTRDLPVGGGGASYLFHRAEGQWRLLAVVRSWGS